MSIVRYLPLCNNPPDLSSSKQQSLVISPVLSIRNRSSGVAGGPTLASHYVTDLGHGYVSGGLGGTAPSQGPLHRLPECPGYAPQDQRLQCLL